MIKGQGHTAYLHPKHVLSDDPLLDGYQTYYTSLF